MKPVDVVCVLALAFALTQLITSLNELSYDLLDRLSARTPHEEG